MVKSIEESKKIASIHLNRLIEEAGSQAHLARMLSSCGYYIISPQGVQRWLKRGQISKYAALVVVNHQDFKNKFTLDQLRPDVTTGDWAEMQEGDDGDNWPASCKEV